MIPAVVVMWLCAWDAQAPAAEPAAPPGPPEAVEVFADCSGCPQMVPVAAGRFFMGAGPDEHHWLGVPQIFANAESPRHEVVIPRPFAIGRFEVTREEYARFADATRRASDPKGCSVPSSTGDVYAYDPAVTWREPRIAVTPRHPVNCVSWNDAQAYVSWLSAQTGRRYRLPTESEWEYAARGGTQTAAYWGDSTEALCTRANVMNSATFRANNEPPSWRSRLMCSGSAPFLVPVGSYEANPFGLSDMIGNVWEWVEDCSNVSYDGAPADGSAWKDGDCAKRVLRGGALHSAPFFGRSASRETGQIPGHVGMGVGFRVVRELQGPPPKLIRVSLVKPVVGDAVAGKDQFAPCTKCHTVDAASPDTSLGPSLHKVFGKAAGTNRAYPYSRALKDSGVIWTDATLDWFVKDPAAMIPDNHMTFVGQGDPQVRANIVAYLKAASR